MVALVVVSLALAVWVYRLKTRLTLLEDPPGGEPINGDAPVVSATRGAWELTVSGGWVKTKGRLVAVIAGAMLVAYSAVLLLAGWLLAWALS
jgi:hypothetical protein